MQRHYFTIRTRSEKSNLSGKNKQLRNRHIVNKKTGCATLENRVLPASEPKKVDQATFGSRPFVSSPSLAWLGSSGPLVHRGPSIPNVVQSIR